MENPSKTSLSERPNYGMPIHAACDLFPLLDTQALAGLAADIRANGLVHPIVLHEGQVVDGRNRLLACRQAGVEPRFVEWKEIYPGPMPVSRWIWSVNVERRHLSGDQIAVIETALHKWEEQEAARQRQLEALKLGPESRRSKNQEMVGHDCAQPIGSSTAAKTGPAGRTREQLAEKIGVSVRKVRQAMAVADDPELLRQVAQGNLSLREAQKRLQVSAPSPSKRQKVLENAAKRRMIAGLSRIRGLCQGLSEIEAAVLQKACTAGETRAWAATAQELSQQLRLFSSKLTTTQGVNKS